MGQSSTYFLRHAEARAAEEQQLSTRSERLNHSYYNRQLINEQWELAAQDKERERQYQRSSHGTKHKQQEGYDLP